MHDRQAATRSERRPFDVSTLRRGARHTVRRRAGGRTWIPDGKPTDVARRAEVRVSSVGGKHLNVAMLSSSRFGYRVADMRRRRSPARNREWLACTPRDSTAERSGRLDSLGGGGRGQAEPRVSGRGRRGCRRRTFLPRRGIMPGGDSQPLFATSPMRGAADASKVARERFPLFCVSLWQRWQYVFTTSLSEAGRCVKLGALNAGVPDRVRRCSARYWRPLDPSLGALSSDGEQYRDARASHYTSSRQRSTAIRLPSCQR